MKQEAEELARLEAEEMERLAQLPKSSLLIRSPVSSLTQAAKDREIRKLSMRVYPKVEKNPKLRTQPTVKSSIVSQEL